MYGYTIFHDNIMESLFDSINAGKSANSYIFAGAKGTYKHECARLFAAALCCTGEKSPCNICSECTGAKANTNPDIKHITKPQNKTRLDVETIRSLCEDVIIRPFTSKKKIYIIDDGDLMTPEAQNAFLKTFEEPPEYAVFIIVCENTDNLLQTIISRASVVSFPAVEKEKVRAYVREKYPDHIDKESFLVNYSEGIPGKIDEVLADEDFYERRQDALSHLGALLSDETEKAFEIEEYIKENSDTASEIFDFWISFLRDMMVLRCGAFDCVINTDLQSELHSLCETTNSEKISNAIDILIEGKHMLARYVKTTAVALRCALKI